MVTAFDATKPEAIAITPLASPNVLLGDAYFYQNVSLDGKLFRINTTDADKQNTLFHELWHVLGIGDLGGSSAFGKWLTDGCKGNPPE